MVAQNHLPKPQDHSAIWVHKDENVRFLSDFTGDSTELLPSVKSYKRKIYPYYR